MKKIEILLCNVQHKRLKDVVHVVEKAGGNDLTLETLRKNLALERNVTRPDGNVQRNLRQSQRPMSTYFLGQTPLPPTRPTT